MLYVKRKKLQFKTLYNINTSYVKKLQKLALVIKIVHKILPKNS